MTDEKKILLDKAYHDFYQVGLIDQHASLDTLEKLVSADFMGYGTAKDERVDSKEDLKQMITRQREQSAGIDMKFDITSVLRKINREENAAVYVDEAMISMNGADSAFQFVVRVTLAFEYEESGWKVIHMHGSVPGDHESETDTWGVDEWKARTKELEKMVAEKTADLVIKNRELQIEAALERVRARAMAMRNSEELKELIGTVFAELTKLDVVLTRCLIMIYDPVTKGSMWWMANSEAQDPIGLFVQYHEKPPYLAYLKAWKEQTSHWEYELSGQVKIDWDIFLFNETGLAQLPAPVIEGMKEPSKVCLSSSFNNFGNLTLATLEPLSAEHFNILLRFAKVFDLTYTRFNDLQKAEGQAREAQIEAALEKIRSRSLAMHRSDELKEVIVEVLRKLQELGVAMENKSAIICLYQEGSKEFEQWVASPEHSSAHMVRATFFDSKIHNDIWDARNNGTDFYAKSYTVEEKNAMFQFFFDHPDLGSIPENEKNWLRERQYYELACAFEKHSAVMIANFTAELLDSGVHEILKRFGKVFEQAYIRFLDLQKAEAQAREAQIEAGLERVRYSAMAMQSSEDVGAATGVVFNEISLLGVEAMRCGITIIHPDKTADVWAATTTHEGKAMKGMGSIDFNAHPLWVGLLEAWENKKENYSYDLKGDDLKSYYTILSQSPNYNSSYIQGQEFPDHTVYASFFEQGAVFTFSLKPHDDEKRKVIKRFTAVFSLTFRRYLDLKQAEAQARESLIEASLERVRSRTLAMQKSDELAETAAEVFRQLIGLGIEPNRLYIGIIKGETGDMEMWATDEDGTQVGKKFMFNKNENDSVRKLYEGWATQQKSVIVNMEGKELEDYFHYLNHVMHIPFKGGLAQKRRVQSVAYFSKGFIGMASPDGQGEQTIQLLERFAAVFNLTFTRFNDLKIAEAHAEQAELDLIQLKEEKKRTEDALNELQATQKQLIQSEKMASLGELTAGIAHEIQNPLNFVNNFSEVSTELVDEMNEEIQKGNLEDAQLIATDLKDNLTKINHHGKRAGEIVKSMLQHSRSSSGQKELTDINALCDEYLRLAYHGLRAKDKSFNASFTTDFDESIPKIGIIPQDIGRVILNLINNAFYAVSARSKQSVDKSYQPTVSVVTQKLDQAISVSVSDNGTGIPYKVVDKIFQPFFTTKPTGEGTGLGLSLSYDIVKAHGGDLKVDTKEGEGSTFIIHLPVA